LIQQAQNLQKDVGRQLGTTLKTKNQLRIFVPHFPDRKKKQPSHLFQSRKRRRIKRATYMAKPPYPQRLKADNKNKDPKKEPKEEKGATNDSVKYQQIQKVPTIPYLPTIMGSNNKTYMIRESVCNKFFEPP
ncbi:hypothetical protein PIB30_092806, partial [Stylosanthes scabra]|nr:hypothetical protein [Stylosanthes scabra]